MNVLRFKLGFLLVVLLPFTSICGVRIFIEMRRSGSVNVVDIASNHPYNTRLRNKDLTSGVLLPVIIVIGLSGKYLLGVKAAIWPAINRAIVYLWIAPIPWYIYSPDLRQFAINCYLRR